MDNNSTIEIQNQFPDHFEVLEKHRDSITLLSKAENHVYGRQSKPLHFHVMFLGAIDVNRITLDGNVIDIRKAHKPSEIEEAKDALDSFINKFLSLNHLITTNSNIEFKINDLAAEAAVEIADVIYNLFQVELFNPQIEVGNLTRSIFETIDAKLLDKLLDMAEIKFSMRYLDGTIESGNYKFKKSANKNVSLENAAIREQIRNSTEGFEYIYDSMINRTGGIKSMLLNVLSDVRNLSDRLGIRYDEDKQDRIIPDEVLF